MTAGLLKSRLTKLTLYKLAVSTGLCSDYDKYKAYRNVYNSLLRLRKKLYYGESLNNASKNPKKIWEILNEITSRKSCSNKIEKIISNGMEIRDENKMADEFNNFFSTVGKKISDSVERISTDPMSYLDDGKIYPNMEFDHIGSSFLCDIINDFVPKKSLDLDGISMSLVKYISTSISVPLAHVFSLSLSTGVFPELLKISRVVPIFKGGDPDLCDNYRPISLVKTFAKLLEKIVAKKLTYHLKVNNIVDPLQFGFQSGLSTEHNLLHLTNYVSKALNENKIGIGVFLDLKKAFDVVPHCILLKKLKYYGMKDNVLQWFESYLDNRSQCVDINGKISAPKFINISVMQGSVLGPLLFLIFINDLPNATILKTLLFADDACSLHSDKNLNELILKVNTELQKIANWFSANKLVVNVNKCKYIIFHTKGKKLNLEGLDVYFNLNEIGKNQSPEKIITLERVGNDQKEKNYKYLGVLIDEHLNFNDNTDYLCNKLAKAVFQLRKAKFYVTKKHLLTLYHALFNSHLWYCTIILSCTSQANLNRILILQKKAIRVVANLDYMHILRARSLN
jgi:hypothetical protein